MKIKYGKMFIVIFLTCLIWVWADLAKTEEKAFSNAMITVDKTATPGLWVSFNEEQTAAIKEIVLKGSSSRIAEAERDIRQGLLSLEFFLNASQEGFSESGTHSLDVLSFLKKQSDISELGLSVVSCDPNTVDVGVVKLMKKELTVECVDENGSTLKTESIEPPKIEMPAPEDWSGTQLKAFVMLSRTDKEQARQEAIEKTPYMKLASSQTRESPVKVKIKLPPTEKGLLPYNVTATVGFTFSINLAGQYTVEIENPGDLSAVNIKATPEAMKAFEDQPYHMQLHILDTDKNEEDYQRREVVYLFPEEFVRADEIMLNEPPAMAKFKLIPKPTNGQN
jgi:hypothetical protein